MILNNKEMDKKSGLKPFKKGQSGNPAGRPVGSRNMKTVLQEILDSDLDLKNPLTGEKGRLEVRQALLMRLIKKGLGGDLFAIREVWDRVDGPIKESIQIEDKRPSVSEKNVLERIDDLADRLAKQTKNRENGT